MTPLPPDRRDEVMARIQEKHRHRTLEKERRVTDSLRVLRLAVVEAKREYEAMGRRLVDLAERLVALQEEWEQRDDTTIRLPALPPSRTAETERIERQGPG